MIASSVDALIRGDVVKAKEVVNQDDVVDELDLEIEHLCLRLIATQQPVAHDLRVIGSALKVITDIERIADYAVDIAKIGRRLAKAETLYRPLTDLPRLTQLSRGMLRDALQAFVNRDLALVEKVIRDDDDVDDLYHQMRLTLTHTIQNEPTHGLLAMNTLFAAKYLERVSDHVVNIAERVYFIETGALKPPKEKAAEAA